MYIFQLHICYNGFNKVTMFVVWSKHRGELTMLCYKFWVKYAVLLQQKKDLQLFELLYHVEMRFSKRKLTMGYPRILKMHSQPNLFFIISTLQISNCKKFGGFKFIISTIFFPSCWTLGNQLVLANLQKLLRSDDYLSEHMHAQPLRGWNSGKRVMYSCIRPN